MGGGGGGGGVRADFCFAFFFTHGLSVILARGISQSNMDRVSF